MRTAADPVLFNAATAAASGGGCERGGFQGVWENIWEELEVCVFVQQHLLLLQGISQRQMIQAGSGVGCKGGVYFHNTAEISKYYNKF